jgi:hypothetical protein
MRKKKVSAARVERNFRVDTTPLLNFRRLIDFCIGIEKPTELTSQSKDHRHQPTRGCNRLMIVAKRDPTEWREFPGDHRRYSPSYPGKSKNSQLTILVLRPAIFNSTASRQSSWTYDSQPLHGLFRCLLALLIKVFCSECSTSTLFGVCFQLLSSDGLGLLLFYTSR